jgi:hypothetical protein
MDAGEGDSTPSPSPDLIPAGDNKTLAENSHGNWNIERGHVTTKAWLVVHSGQELGPTHASQYLEAPALVSGCALPAAPVVAATRRKCL